MATAAVTPCREPRGTSALPGGEDFPHTDIAVAPYCHPPSDARFMAELDALIARQQNLFGHDLRLAGKHEVVETNGGWRLRVEARSPTERAG